MKKMFKSWSKKLPWNRPSLSDLPVEERRRAKAMMLGAGVHHAKGRVEVEHTEPENEVGIEKES
jgi:hypothetical protein